LIIEFICFYIFYLFEKVTLALIFPTIILISIGIPSTTNSRINESPPSYLTSNKSVYIEVNN